MTNQRGKDVWTSRLPGWRDEAVGVAATRTVYVVTVLASDPRRFIRLEIPSDHARTLAGDLMLAADQADATEFIPRPTPVHGFEQIDLLDELITGDRTA